MDRPDLEEFLFALNGILDKKPISSKDPSHLRFLEIFLRSVGSNEGHLLRSRDDGALESAASFGLSEDFDKAVNASLEQSKREPSPLDRAFAEQKVVPIVELKPEPGSPKWFLDIMQRFEFKSLIAVPLLGPKHTIGVLCAYYRDVCLFDQGTVDRMMMIGRMAGAALEKSNGSAPAAEAPPSNFQPVDDLLRLLTTQTFSKLQIFSLLAKAVTKTISPEGLVIGPIRLVGDEVFMTVAEGTGIPPTAVSHRFRLPAFLKQALSGQKVDRTKALPSSDWEEMKTLLASKAAIPLCQSILYLGHMEAVVLAWRSEKYPFEEKDEQMLERLSRVVSLAARIV